jgi:hypothetical protein
MPFLDAKLRRRENMGHSYIYIYRYTNGVRETSKYRGLIGKETNLLLEGVTSTERDK